MNEPDMKSYRCEKCGFRSQLSATIPHNTDRKCWSCNERMENE